MLHPARTLVKICGLSTPETVEAALGAGADMVGFVRFARSPRHVARDLGRALSAAAQGRATRVLLVVDPEDAELEADVAAIDPDLIQLHGRETPERVAAIRARFGRPVMKAVGIATAADLANVARHAGVADRILLDAKAPPGAALPGGNGRAFDWGILAGALPFPLGEKGARLEVCVMLSGGLTAANVADAIRISGLAAVDVSSGVETAPGRKDPGLIAAFVGAARAATTQPQTRERAVA